MTSSGTDAAADTVAMGPDCSIRSIDAAYRAIRLIRPVGGRLRVDCSRVEQADITFAQLIASAQKTFATQDIDLVIDPVPACVRAAFDRSGIRLPGVDERPPS